MEASLLIGFCIATVISIAAWRVRALDRSGAIAALVMGAIVFGIGGWMPSIALVLFFVSGSALSALPGKAKVVSMDESGGRSWKQVLANGAVATVLILASAILPSRAEFLLVVAVASIAAAAADSWSTEIGTRFGGIPRDILNLRPTPAGLSGGVSTLGLLSAIVGGLLVATSSLTLQASGRLLLPITLSAFCGAVCDSILGSSLQAKYRCTHCGEITENPMHCSRPASLIKGLACVDNNVVNFAATAISAFFCALLLDFGS